MIKAVIFDLDGLLIDSEPYWEKADTIIIKSFGHKYNKNSPLRDKMRGRGTRECSQFFIKYFKLNETVENFMRKRWDIGYPLLEKGLVSLPGSISLIKKLAKYNLPLALATGGHTEEKAWQFLKKLGIHKFFSIIVSGLNIKKGKPDPEIYLLTAKKLKVNPTNCLVLEDAVNGITAAKAAGMLAFGVNKNKVIRSELKKAGADKVFRDLKFDHKIIFNSL